MDSRPGSLLARTTVVGGELFKTSTLERLRRLIAPGSRVINEYGHTETTIGCIAFEAHGWAGSGAQSVPLGRPIWNTQQYVLDAALRPTPAGTPGELYVAGVQLARGYVNLPGLTAERFIADPYGPPGGRMYRTGDMVCWKTNGDLEFVGRTDSPVKLHGYRIGLEEIEATLCHHPCVAHAVAVLREDRPGDQRLVAYVVPASPHTVIDREALREHAAAVLPDYMIPSTIVALTELPITGKGKLDRNALPAPSAATTRGRAPRNHHEETLCHLFAEFLAVPGVSIDDGFFALGGHSLLAARLASRIRHILGTHTTVRDIFNHPTPAALATTLIHHQHRPRPALTRRKP